MIFFHNLFSLISTSVTFFFHFFSDWHTSVFKIPLDTATVSEVDLASLLRQFYCEASPQQSEARRKKLGSAIASTYHKNSLKNIRAALNRHLTDIGRNIDIVHGANFKSANRTLDGFMKEQMRAGKSRPTEHKPIIAPEDLKKIADYFSTASTSPIILRQCVWFNLGLHFVSRGLEFHHQLKPDSFDFSVDPDGMEYVTINHETQQKNFQGGLTKDESPTDRRMYATGMSDCPVAMLKLFLSKTDPSATSLFNCCEKAALVNPMICDIWFTSSPLSKRFYTNFMGDICKSANTTGWYTAHSIRATAIQAMNDSGFEARHIMYMSGHRQESSLKSYCRNPSIVQKRQLSTTLSSISSGTKSPSSASTATSVSEQKSTPPTPPTVMDTENEETSAGRSNKPQQPKCELSTLTDLTNTLFQSNSFSNCSFQISLAPNGNK